MEDASKKKKKVVVQRDTPRFSSETMPRYIPEPEEEEEPEPIRANPKKVRRVSFGTSDNSPFIGGKKGRKYNIINR